MPAKNVQLLDGRLVAVDQTEGTYSITEFTSQTTVTVSHYMGAYPAVQVIDSTGGLLIPLSVTHISINQLTVTFSASTSGHVLLTKGGGDILGYVKQTTLTDQSTMVYDIADGVNRVWTPGATRTLPVPVLGAGNVAAGVSGQLVLIQTASGWGVNPVSAWDMRGADIADFALLANGKKALLSWVSMGGGDFISSLIL